MLFFEIVKKHIISGYRGEYIDFVISRIAFVLFTSATAYIFEHSMGSSLSHEFINTTGTNGYLSYALVGAILYGASLMVFLIVSRSLMTEWRGGTLEYIVMAPHSRWIYYTGALVGQLSMIVIDVIIWVILASCLGVNWSINPIMLVVGIIGLFLALLGTSVITSIFMAMTGDTYLTQNTILPIIFLLGGFLFPPNVLPVPISNIANWLPFARSIQAVRAGMFAGQAIPPKISYYFFDLAASLLIIIIGVNILPRIERRALESLHS